MSKEEIIEKCEIKKKPLELLRTIAFNLELMGITCFGDVFKEIEKPLQRLEEIDNAETNKALKIVNALINGINNYEKETHLQNTGAYIGRDTMVELQRALLKSQEQEKENELLKEIIKSLFDSGCPLHQYIDKDFGLTIEVDDECSIMRLGKYKGVNLDIFLKEVLNNE